jgi:hypothetical protein
MPDQVIRQVVEMISDHDRIGQLVEDVGTAPLDALYQVVQPYRTGETGRTGGPGLRSACCV